MQCSVPRERREASRREVGKIAGSQNKNGLVSHGNVFGFYFKCVEKSMKWIPTLVLL